MLMSTPKIDHDYIINKTFNNRKWLSKIKRAVDDDDKERRREKGFCRCCYYLENQYGLCVITEANCGECGKEIKFTNSLVDVLCKECANNLGLCVHCGGDREDKMKRNFEGS